MALVKCVFLNGGSLLELIFAANMSRARSQSLEANSGVIPEKILLLLCRLPDPGLCPHFTEQIKD